jgi:hypothetical protein
MHLGTGWEMCPNHMPASRPGGGGACRRRAFLFKPHERSVALLGNCEQPVGLEGARQHEPQGTQKILVEGEASKHPGAQLSVPACSSELLALVTPDLWLGKVSLLGFELRLLQRGRPRLR